MRIRQLISGGIIVAAMGLAGCGPVETPAATTPAATAEAAITATGEVDPGSMVTAPEQATREAVPAADTATFTPTPKPSPTNTPLPTATAKPKPSPTPTDTPEMVTLAEGSSAINVRGGPGTAYPIVTQLEPGAAAAVIGRNDAESWWQIDREGETGWVFAELVAFSGDEAEVAVGESPPPPPTATPTAAPAQSEAETTPDSAEADNDTPPNPEELESTLRCDKDFCITYQAMVPIWENGGCIGNHSIFVTVLEGPPPGKPLDGIVVGDTFNNIEVASGDKGPGFAEVTLWMNTMSLKVKRHINGMEYTSEESFPFTAHDELIPAEVLAANGYCDGNIETCRGAQNSNRVCRGHYSWKVTFHKFD
jgi:uncharacterized protein YraI